MIIIQSPTPNLTLSKTFYSQLGFALADSPNGFMATAKNLTIEITTNSYSRAGLKILKEDWTGFVEDNAELNITKNQDGYLVTSPSGCCVYLVNSGDSVINKLTNDSVLGNFAGFSLETNQIQDSVQFWEYFGFKQTVGNIEQGWVMLKNEEGFKISLMKHGACPHLFFNPSLTFFNGKENLAIIARIRELGIPPTQEITTFNENGIVDNIIVRDPGGLGYFIFND